MLLVNFKTWDLSTLETPPFPHCLTLIQCVGKERSWLLLSNSSHQRGEANTTRLKYQCLDVIGLLGAIQKHFIDDDDHHTAGLTISLGKHLPSEQFSPLLYR